MRMLTAILFMVAIIGANVVFALDDNEEIVEEREPFNFLVYSVTWQPTFCLMKSTTEGCDSPPQRFLSHGIWPYSKSESESEHKARCKAPIESGTTCEPRRTNRHPQFCTTSPSCDDNDACPMGEKDMEEVLANADLRNLVTREPRGMFAHEWRKHGTCSGKSMMAYFNDLVDLRKKVTVDENDPAFQKMIGKETLFSLIREVFPDNTSFRCHPTKDGKQYLHEVFYLLDREGSPYLQEQSLQIGRPCEEKMTLIPPGV